MSAGRRLTVQFIWIIACALEIFEEIKNLNYE